MVSTMNHILCFTSKLCIRALDHHRSCVLVEKTNKKKDSIAVAVIQGRKDVYKTLCDKERARHGFYSKKTPSGAIRGFHMGSLKELRLSNPQLITIGSTNLEVTHTHTHTQERNKENMILMESD